MTVEVYSERAQSKHDERVYRPIKISKHSWSENHDMCNEENNTTYRAIVIQNFNCSVLHETS